MIPGLEPAPEGMGALEAAVRSTIEVLHQLGLVEPKHAARCALAVELAQIITEKRKTGKTSTVANDAKVLVELLEQLVPVDDASTDETLRRAMEEWSREVARSMGRPA